MAFRSFNLLTPLEASEYINGKAANLKKKYYSYILISLSQSISLAHSEFHERQTFFPQETVQFLESIRQLECQFFITGTQ